MVLRLKQQRRAGFTLMEMLVVVAIIVALAGIGGFFVMGQLASGQKDAALAQVKGPLTNACQAYNISMGKYPDSLQMLLGKDEKGRGPYLINVDALRDPWGQLYQYDASGNKNGNLQPDIWTTAPASGGNPPEVIGNWVLK